MLRVQWQDRGTARRNKDRVWADKDKWSTELSLERDHRHNPRQRERCILLEATCHGNAFDGQHGRSAGVHTDLVG